MTGRHERPRAHRWGPAAAGAVVVVLLALGVTWAVVRVQSDSGTAAPHASATASLTPETAATSGTAGNPPSSSASASSTTGGDALTAAQRSLTACATTIAAREQLARAAGASARDWATHTGAQRRLDSGEWTLARAKAAWASSKARGPADLEQFAAAEAAVESDASGCRSVVEDTTSTALAEKGSACAAREKALLAVTSAGSVVNAQWAAHQKMMAAKAHTSQGAYQDRWITMVAGAEAPLQRYAAAAAALERAPVCTP